MTFMASDLLSRRTFVVERWRKGSNVLVASVMSASGLPSADILVDWAKVPLQIREAAREALPRHRKPPEPEPEAAAIDDLGPSWRATR